MRNRTTSWILVAVAISSACAGAAAAPPAETAPAAAREQLRLRALAVAAASAVAPAEAARQLMDFGEARFPNYFPVHAETQTFGPFLFRYYPPTGVYLAVVVQDGQGYQYLGVYVMGGPFGQAPQFVGPLASFITPVDPGPSGPGPTGTSNGCFDQLLALDEVPGTRVIEVQRLVDGPGAGGFFTTDIEGIGPAVFEGQAVFQQRIRHAQASYPGGIPQGADMGQVNFGHYRKTGPAEITHHGDLSLISSTSSGGGFTSSTQMEIRTVNVPPRVDRLYSLPVGGSDATTTTYRALSTSTITITGQPPRTTTTESTQVRTETVRFLRRERVTVPLGTFNACVFESTASDDPGGSLTYWIADGKGVGLKYVSVGQGSVSTTETTAASINGQPVTP